MKVYYFTSSKYGLQNIERSRLKVSDFKNVNDPFELLAVELSDKSLRAKMKSFRNSLTDKHGLLCFSESRDNPVQWGHYGDNHRGLCLGFEVRDSTLRKVDYVTNRIKVDDIKKPKSLEKVLTTKFKHWIYEEEQRKIIDLSDRAKQDELYFEPFSDDLTLKEVYIGCQSKTTHTDVIKSVQKSLSCKNIKIYYTRPAFKEFRIVLDKSKKEYSA